MSFQARFSASSAFLRNFSNLIESTFGTVFIATFLAGQVIANTSFGHGGGTIKSGTLADCHNETRTGKFHCHSGSPYSGRSWPSKEDALRELRHQSVNTKSDKNETTSNTSSEKTKSAAKLKRGYSRKEFQHWIDLDGNCRNTRQELLIERSLAPVTFSISKKGKCTVKTGKWADFYFDETLERADQIDIDHIVPLKHAWDLGADSWDASKRRDFANDPDNIVITNLKYNRQKGAKTILEWHPIGRVYACKYMAKWLLVKERYKLLISKQELDNKKLLKCDESTILLPIK